MTFPITKSKTPLQRSIQLLKRHRDSLFQEDDHKPISAIITTLAAHAYDGEGTLTSALRTILRNMDRYIEERNGVKWVQNPVNPHENFADKWPESPAKQEKFYTWLDRARRDFGSYLAARYDAIPDQLRDRMTGTTINSITSSIVPVVSTTETTAAVASEVEHVRSSGSATKPWGM